VCGYVHLRVKEAGGLLHNGDGLVVDGNGVEVVLAVTQNGDELQAEFTRVQIGGEGVGNSLLLACGDLDRVFPGSQIADNLGLASSSFVGQRAGNKTDANWLGLVVADGQASFRGMTVDELNTKDLGLGEGDGDLDVEVGRLRVLGGLFDGLSLGRGLAD
jgi:hypothetical protein